MGACGCPGRPDESFVIETPKGDFVQVAIWRKKCDFCETEPLVQFGLISTKDAEEERETGNSEFRKALPMWGEGVFWLDKR